VHNLAIIFYAKSSLLSAAALQISMIKGQLKWSSLFKLYISWLFLFFWM